MVAFATTALMEAHTGGVISAATHPGLDAQLDAASALIRRICGWHIAPEQTVIARHHGPFVEDVWLPAMAIASIDSATVDGSSVDAATVRFDPDSGWTNLRGSSWEVELTAGYDKIPEEIVALTLQVAARATSSPAGVTREQIGQHSVSFALTSDQSSGGIVLLEAERATLAHYRLGWLP